MTCPYPLFDAIERALLIIDWQENLPSEDMPPQMIWYDDEALNDHFEWVKRKRDAEADDRTVWDDSNSKQNQAAKELIVGG